jgi:hypothetical protein
MSEQTGVRPQVSDSDCLVPLWLAAKKLGVTEESVGDWHVKYRVPLVRSPGRFRFTYESWLAMVLASPRPGRAGDMQAVTDAWWDRYFPGARQEAA